jgi:dolichyl-phosphate beta-glucosyltransferase
MDLSIIVPAYNEEKRLGRTLDSIRTYFQGKEYSYEVLIVDDGSKDNTSLLAEKSLLSTESKSKIIKNNRNRGKGYSVRAGVRKAEGDLILLSDADLSTPIEEFEKLGEYISRGFDIAIGSRSVKGADVRISQPKYRVLMGKTFNFMVRALLLRGFIDTQCGFKLFKKNCIKDIEPDMKIDGFSFDVEMLYLALKKGYTVKEVPVVWEDFKGSKVNPFYDSARMFKDLLYIKAIHIKK